METRPVSFRLEADFLGRLDRLGQALATPGTPARSRTDVLREAVARLEKNLEKSLKKQGARIDSVDTRE